MHLLRQLIVLLLVLLLAGCDRGQEPAPLASATAEPPAEPQVAPPPSSAPKTAPARPFLYRVSGENGGGWLFGTVHLGADADEVLHPAVFEKLEAAETMVLEVDLASMGGSAMQKLMQPTGKSLKDQLTPAQWEKLPRLVGPLMPTAALERLKPAAAYSLILARMLPSTEPMDKALQNRAKKHGAKLVYLETVDDQLALLDEVITPELLGHEIDDSLSMKQNLDKMVEAYRKGDAATLSATAFEKEEMEESPAMYEKLFYARNAAWVKQLDPLLKKGDVFVAVGAGHLLGGERSVPAELEKLGWKIERFEID